MVQVIELLGMLVYQCGASKECTLSRSLKRLDMNFHVRQLLLTWVRAREIAASLMLPDAQVKVARLQKPQHRVKIWVLSMQYLAVSNMIFGEHVLWLQQLLSQFWIILLAWHKTWHTRGSKIRCWLAQPWQNNAVPFLTGPLTCSFAPEIPY